jgi:uncharacterized membrane protein
MIKKLFFRSLEVLRSLFFNGLLIVLPITLTFAIFHTFFKLIKGWLEPLNACLPCCWQIIPQSEIIVVFILILIIGIFVKFFLLKPLIHAIENQLLLKIPLVRAVYSGLKQLVGAFTVQDQTNLNTIAMLEFPTPGCYTLGFVTGQMPPSLTPNPDEIHYNLFIPTTPNPTSGFFVILPASKFKIVDLTRQEAMTLIISGGIIRPDRFKI